jgi:hypothetical protein
MNDYFDKLDSSYFPPITNGHLTKVDLYNNYYTLERELNVVILEFYELSPISTAPLTLPWSLRAEHAVIDLRTSEEFDVSHLPGATNLPISILKRDSPSPFFDAELFAEQWRELESLFGGGDSKMASPLAVEFAR